LQENIESKQGCWRVEGDIQGPGGRTCQDRVDREHGGSFGSNNLVEECLLRRKAELHVLNVKSVHIDKGIGSEFIEPECRRRGTASHP